MNKKRVIKKEKKAKKKNIIKDFKRFAGSGYAYNLTKLIETPKDAEQFKRELNNLTRKRLK